MKSRNKIAIINIASISIVSLLGFISGPIFSGMLGTDGYGIFSVYMVWVNLSRMIFSLGAENAIPQASVDFDSIEQKKYHSSVFSLGTISYLLFSCTTVLIVLLFNKYIGVSVPLVICGLIHGWGLFSVSLMNTKYIYEFDAAKNAILSTMLPFLSIVFSVILIPLFSPVNKYWGRVLGEVGTYLIVAIIIGVILVINGKTIINKRYWIYTLPITLPLVVHLLSGMVLSQCDRVMIQKMIDNSAVGIYSLAYVFASIINSLWVALNRSWVPFFYEFQNKNDVQETRVHSKNYVQLFSVITSGFILLSREVFRIYANKSFWTGDVYIPIFALSYYIMFLYSFIVNYEMYYKKTKLIAMGTSIAAFVNLLLNFVLIKRIGVTGALLATVLSSLIQLIFHWRFGSRTVKSIFPFRIKDFVPGVMIVLISFILFYICINHWIIRWGFAAILGFWILISILKRKEIF